MDENLRQLLSELNAHEVRYLIIGGYAVFVHAQPRMTKDLDVFIESSPSNALALYKALAVFGAPLSGLTVQDLSDGKTGVRFGNPPICFDILQKIDGDLPARYISADDFITNKLASGRLQDLADVEAVRNRRRVLKDRTP